MALEREIQTFREQLSTLLQNEGKFALVHGEDVAGFFETYEDAIKAGYEKYGLEPFLVKKIQAMEEVQHFTRDFVECLI